jgi:hypothetical protein
MRPVVQDLTAAQVWYVARVQPESITPEEAQQIYDYNVGEEADRAYWEAAARVLKTLSQQ